MEFNKFAVVLALCLLLIGCTIRTVESRPTALPAPSVEPIQTQEARSSGQTETPMTLTPTGAQTAEPAQLPTPITSTQTTVPTSSPASTPSSTSTPTPAPTFTPVPTPSSPIASSTASPSASPTLAPGLKSWIYVLTGYERNLQDIVRTPSDIVVVDAFKQTPDVPFSAAEVEEFKKNHKIVLAYMSIGEAEDYRYYWKSEWKTSPPKWLGKVNPDWGSMKVKYWNPDWQAIVFGYLDKIVAQGFDGVYLDIVDGYEYWSDSDNEENEVLYKNDAANRMVSFISAIRQRARAKNPVFKVFPQNAAELVNYDGYLGAVDGIGKETTWFEGYSELLAPGSTAKPVDPDATAEQVGFLRRIKQAGKTVVVVDYFAPSQSTLAADFVVKARSEGFIPYAADARALDKVSSFFVS